MPDIFHIGFESISSLLQDLAENFSLFEGVQWRDLFDWMNLPSDISVVVVIVISLFILITTVGFIKKLFVFFG